MPKNLKSDLAGCIQGQIKTDFFTKKIYSIDASIYQIEPLGVVYPKTTEDIRTVVAYARNNQLPVIPRGAGTGVAGGCIGRGIVLDLSKYMNRILEVNYDKEYAVCEPGVIQDQLNAVLFENGYRLGPNTSTGNRATIGGMVACNASGSHSLRYGKMVDRILETGVLLSNGCHTIFSQQDTTLRYGESSAPDCISTIYRVVDEIRDTLKEEIGLRFPKIQRRVSGYNLDELITDNPLNLAKLITGSEGTLGIVTSVKVEICRRPAVTGLCILKFDGLNSALDLVESILEFNPLAVELIDHHIIKSARKSSALKRKNRWLTDIPAAMLIVEFAGESLRQLRDTLNSFASRICGGKSSPKVTQLIDMTAIEDIWKLRKAGLGLLMARRTNERAVAFLEDIAVPPSKLSQFIREFRAQIQKTGKEAGFYGHAGAGCIHVRPMLDLRKGHDVDIMVRMMEDISELVLEYGGAVSGEHGDGLVRSWLNEKMFGTKIYEAFKAVKTAFDPDNVMNPGKIINAGGPRENLRVGPEFNSQRVETVFDFTNEGGFEFALSMCNGNGECRKTMTGIMCPSFHVTNDENDTTRARVQALLAALAGVQSLSDLSLEGLYDVMDLCIACKGCQRECPSQIDMAKIKAEFLYHYYRTRRRPIRDYIFGGVDTFNRLGSLFSPLSNRLINSALHKRLMRSFGIDPRRDLPQFAVEKFSTWFRNRRKPSRKLQRDKILLFVDTFTEYNHPEIGKAAVKIMDQLDCHTAVSRYLCCGRPLISKGLLDDAKIRAAKNIRDLLEYVDNGYKVIGLEPSCILTLKDEYPSLLNTQEASKIARVCSTIDVYLEELLDKGALDLPLSSESANVTIHGHCHQKAIEGIEPTLNVLQALPGLSVRALNSGCCGMAGSFGYEREHYDFSLKLAETRLFPGVRACSDNTIIIANGISCRQQIKHGTGRMAKHLVTVLADRML